jgi:hypothetical protein
MTDPCTEATRLKRIEDKQDLILEALNGNGQPGIKTRLALVEERIQSLGKWGGRGWSAVLIVVSVVLTAVVSHLF